MENIQQTITNTEQIPARMLNEFAYCPRLFYLEHVQREWAHSADTLDGRFTHRRVDKESGAVPSSEEISEEIKIHARSVLIGSDNFGVTARIDLLEGEGLCVTPVDYKRGKPPDVAEGAYEPERVQVCIQGLLLRDNGYESNEGVIYFAESQQRVTVPFTDELITRTLLLLAQAKRVAVSGKIPSPLINSPKCPKCSLVGICLPDEVNFLRANEEDSEEIIEFPTNGQIQNPKSKIHNRGAVRRLVPARDDALAVYVQGQGFSVGLKGDVLEIRDKGKAISESRLIETSQVNLFGNVQLSAQALRELASREITVMHLSYGGWLSAVTTPPPHKNIELRQRQFRSAMDEELCLRLARSFVSGKIRNSRTLLRRNAREVPTITLARLKHWRERAEHTNTIETLLGIEGNAAKDYFKDFALMFKSQTDETLPAFDFTGRNRRPPRDPVNALLSFLYSMLMKEMLVAVIGVGFDPYQGFYHQSKYGKPALALDLMEEFRPLVADSVVINLINNGEIKLSDFISRSGMVNMTDSGRKRVIEAFERRLNMLVTHPIFGYTISYRRVFEMQARLLARFLTGEIKEYPPFCTR